jgi:DNA-directed RNA polymerase subunit omega
MIDALRNEALIRKVGGRFRLTALIQKRWLELMRGERPMVDPSNKGTLEVVVQEILEGKIGIDFEASGLSEPKA